MNFYDELELIQRKQNDIFEIQKKVTGYFEGKKLMPYKDTVGKWTIGIGHNFDDNGFEKSHEDMIRKRLNDYITPIKNLVIEKGIIDEECSEIFRHDIKVAEKDARRLVSNFGSLNIYRQIALIDFSFNVGYNVFFDFKNTRKFIEQGNFYEAANGFKNSKWYKQVRRRGPIICDIIKNGKFSDQFMKSAGI